MSTSAYCGQPSDLRALEGYITPHNELVRAQLNDEWFTGYLYRVNNGQDILGRANRAFNTEADFDDYNYIPASRDLVTPEEYSPGLVFTEVCVQYENALNNYEAQACDCDC